MKAKHFYPVLLMIVATVLLIAGCKKDTTMKPAKTSTQTNANLASKQDSMVATPGGWLPKSHVHMIEPGSHIDITSGHVLKIETASGKVMADFGEIHQSVSSPQNPQQSPGITHNFNSLPTVPGGTDGWVAATSFDSYYPFTYFSTTWAVPGPPQSTTGLQNIFIFNAVAKSEGGSDGDIMQPVLQWGASYAGGSNSWTIASYYGWAGNQYFAFTTPVPVTTTSVTGVINYTGLTGTSFNYNVSFTGYPATSLNVVAGTTHQGTIGNVNTTVTFPTISPETWAFEALESYNTANVNGGNGVASASNYPSQYYVAMTNITLNTTGGPPASFQWGAVTVHHASVGEHFYDVSDNVAGSGEVDLYFHPTPIPTFTYWTPDAFTINKPITTLTPSNADPTGATPMPTSYTISPALPAGLSINPSTGYISGTPTALSAATNYTITGTGIGGSVGTFVMNLAIVNGAFTFISSTS